MAGAVPEHLFTPASNESEEAGRQVTGRVDGIPRVHAQGHPNDANKDAYHQGLSPLKRWIVLLVCDGEKTQLEQRGQEHLGSKRHGNPLKAWPRPRCSGRTPNL